MDRAAAAEAATKTSGDYIEYLDRQLKDDGDTIVFRPLFAATAEVKEDEPTVFAYYNLHKLPQVSEDNKRFWRDFFCLKDEAEDDLGRIYLEGECQYCVNPEDGAQVQTAYAMWVYAYKSIHLGHVEGAMPATNAGGQIIYERQLEVPMLWLERRAGVKAQLVGIKQRYGKFSDRDYSLTRVGAKGSSKTQYTVTPDAPSPLTDVQRELELPVPSAVIDESIRQWSQWRDIQAGVAEPSSPRPEDVAVPEGGYHPVSMMTPATGETPAVPFNKSF